MPLTQQHRDSFTKWYCIIFYILLLVKRWNGLLLCQVQPHLYNTRFDMLTWLIMKTGIHVWLIDNSTGWIIFDVAFYTMPLLFYIAYRKSVKAGAVAAIVMMLVNWLYIECYTLYPTNSIESYMPWLLFPFLFMTTTLTGFYYVLNALRYFFLYFFVSAALWKVAQHGLFYTNEMSGILLYQHKEYLVSSPGSGYTIFIYWLINHPAVSYALYIAAAATELLFAAGFFTKKYDKALIVLFLLFLVMDVIIMRIPYWEMTPFALTLIYSKYSLHK